MHTRVEEKYSFRISETNLEQIYSDITCLLQPLPTSIYDEVFICLHELVINSIQEMKTIHKENQLITIDLVLLDSFVILCLKDQGRGINPSQFHERNQNPLKESGRGLDIITMLTDWFFIYSENNCYAYYVIKKIRT